MEGTPRLYDTLVVVLSQHQNWVDRRHLKTLAWMIVGLMQSGRSSLTAWAPYVHSRAVFAQSTVRRFTRWLEAEGSRFVEAMMTVVATLKQQHRNVLAYVTAACEAARRGEPAPSLLPTPDFLNQGMRPAA
jgi:hypothetical protein